jgi:hypothetical protein
MGYDQKNIAKTAGKKSGQQPGVSKQRSGVSSQQSAVISQQSEMVFPIVNLNFQDELFWILFFLLNSDY